jgi:hypothetical protein
MSAMSRAGLRILIVAEHASAAFGGEAFLPLQYFRVLRARGIEAWLVCHGRGEQEIRDAFPDQQDRSTSSATHRSTARCGRSRRCRGASRRDLRRGEPPADPAAGAPDRAQLVKEKRIDVVHEPIPVSPRQPSAMFGSARRS